MTCHRNPSPTYNFVLERTLLKYHVDIVNNFILSSEECKKLLSNNTSYVTKICNNALTHNISYAIHAKPYQQSKTKKKNYLRQQN
jgi:hypothetical protein